MTKIVACTTALLICLNTASADAASPAKKKLAAPAGKLAPAAPTKSLALKPVSPVRQPSATPKLDLTKKPLVTPKPDLTKKPIQPIKPADLVKKPIVTPKPDLTKKPAVIKPADLVKKPVQLPKPDLGKKPIELKPGLGKLKLDAVKVKPVELGKLKLPKGGLKVEAINPGKLKLVKDKVIVAKCPYLKGDYHLKCGTLNQWGLYCYQGINHCHWHHCIWDAAYGCYIYYCPSACCYYYWVETCECYVPCYWYLPAGYVCESYYTHPYFLLHCCKPLGCFGGFGFSGFSLVITW